MLKCVDNQSLSYDNIFLLIKNKNIIIFHHVAQNMLSVGEGRVISATSIIFFWHFIFLDEREEGESLLYIFLQACVNTVL